MVGGCIIFPLKEKLKGENMQENTGQIQNNAGHINDNNVVQASVTATAWEGKVPKQILDMLKSRLAKNSFFRNDTA